MLAGLSQAAEGALTIRVFDYINVPQGLEKASGAARELFARADIGTEWRICRANSREGACEEITPKQILVKIVQRPWPNYHKRGAYGAVIRDGDVNVAAYIFYERLAEDAEVLHLSPEVLLANVMAHEVGHMMGLEHTSDGLMSRQFGRMELRRAAQGALSFSAVDERRLQAALYVKKTQP